MKDKRSRGKSYVCPSEIMGKKDTAKLKKFAVSFFLFNIYYLSLRNYLLEFIFYFFS